MLKIVLLNSDILINVQKNMISELECDTSSFKKQNAHKILRHLNKFLG